MATLIKAPSINEVVVEKLSANYATLRWDDVGRNFYYLVEMRNVTSGGEWTLLRHVSVPFITLVDLKAQEEYEVRISVSSRGFERSEYTYSEVFKTFMFNLYNISVMNELTLADGFIEEKFTNDNKTYVDFNNDVVYASLMSNDFIFNPSVRHISNIRDKILRREEYHEVLNEIRKLCTDDKRVMVGYIDEVLYMTERYQKLAKTSNDRGQTWQTIDMFDGRLGDPITNVVFQQNNYSTFALGYDHVYQGKPSSNVRWSSIKERFSQTDITFTRMDDALDLGYEIEIFNRYAKLPEELSKGKAESFTVTDKYIFVAGNGVIRYMNIEEPKFDEEPTSPNYGQRIFEDVKLGNYASNIVIKKMDTMNGIPYFFISGKLKSGKLNKRDVNNIESSIQMGVYTIDTDTMKIKRVFGNDLDERNSIEHKYSNMSTNGKEIFVSYANYQFDKYTDEVREIENGVEKGDFIISSTIKRRGYLNSAKVLMGSFRASMYSPSKWERGFMKYYNEASFSYMARSGNRSFITPEKRIGIVSAEMDYTHSVELEGKGSDDRILGETWEDGRVEITIPNIHFTDFKKYSSGIMIYKAEGELIGFFEYNVDVINKADIIWKPKLTLLIADLIGQVRQRAIDDIPLDRPEDPNLEPFIKKIVPENYFKDSDIEQSRLYEFIKLYMEYISERRDSTYKKLINLTRDKDPLSVDSIDYLWDEMYKRNIYLSRKKKEETIRFFLDHKNDFYSSAGTIASYKYLFKLLYNEDVEIDDESGDLNYYLTVDMKTIDDNIIGQYLFTPSGRCIVTNIERVYIDGKKMWQLSVSNTIGVMYAGQIVKSENGKYDGIIEVELRGKEYLHNDIDYINGGQEFYVMRIKSKLPLSHYHDDIIRFVHPIGINFMGIIDLTIFLNAGIHFRHVETEINKYKNLRFSNGIPIFYPPKVRVFDGNGIPMVDSYTGEPLYQKSVRFGEKIEIDEAKYDEENKITDFSKIKNLAMRKFLQENKPSQRRMDYSPTFDSSGSTFSIFTDMTKSFLDDSHKYRLVDNVGRPRDPKKPTQGKLEKDI